MTQAEFEDAFQNFYKAGLDLVEKWDDPDTGFNADEVFPLPDRLKPPLSMDEWLTELFAHYQPDTEAFEATFIAAEGLPGAVRAAVKQTLVEFWPQDRTAQTTNVDEYDKAWALLDTLPFPIYDGSGCRYLDLGKRVYGLIDYDAGHYRVGLYYELDGDIDDGGVCAMFKDFESFKSFVLRLDKVKEAQA